MNYRLLFVLILFVGLEQCPLIAQVDHPADSAAADSSTMHSATGVVLDPSGAAVSGALVGLRGAGGEVLARATTDASGSFRFDKVPFGKYTLDFHADGFRDSQLEITIADRRPPFFRVVLQILAQTETVTVATGESVGLISTEAQTNQNTNSVDRDALDRLPVFDHDYISAMSRFLDDNAIGTNGVTLVVNGIEANGPGVTPSAVQEVKINNDPYSARFSRPGRARLEIITKGGSQDYHGSANFMFRDSVFDASNAFAVVKPPERRQYYEGSVSGPFGHGKRTSFLLSLDDDILDQQDIIDANAIAAAESLGLGSSPQTLPNPTHHFFGSGRIFHDLTNGDQFWNWILV